MSQRLDQDDAYLYRFESEVSAHQELRGRTGVVLRASAFYPESGGQMADRGTLGGKPVVDVQKTDDGQVVHFLEGELPGVGAALEGQIDVQRRADFRALHTGQHIFSRVLLDVADAATISSRLGEDDCTLDIDKDSLSKDQQAEIVSRVQQIIDEGREVRAYFPSEEELSKLTLRRTIKVKGNVRVVEVEGADFTPCGGTHVKNTSEIVLFHLLGTERRKGKLRFHFDTGPRARRRLFAESEALRELSSQFTCGPLEVAAAIDRLKRDLSSAKAEAKAMTQQLAAAKLTELKGSGANPIVKSFDFGGQALVRALAVNLCEDPQMVVFLAAKEGEQQAVFVGRGEEADFNCSLFFKEARQKYGLKGGGRPERGEGRLASEVDWEEIVNNYLSNS